ncbi:MAG: response regulator [Pirellulales bacterium]
MTEQTVFIVDDDPAVRESVHALFRARGFLVRSFGSADEFMQGYAAPARGCLIVDLRMPGIGGLELQQWLAERGFALPVIMITGFATVPTAVQAMQQGAIDFLEKPCRPAELIARVSQVLERDRELWEADEQRRLMQQRLTNLSPPEKFVLDQIVAGKPNKVIAREARQSLRWVEARRAAIFRQLDADSLAELLRLVLAVQRTPDE